MKKSFFLLKALFGLLLICSNYCYSQKIKGLILNKPKNIAATISAKSGNSDQIQEFKLVSTDSFEWELKKTYDTLRIICTLKGYVSDSALFIKPVQDKILTTQFHLKKDTLNRLEEIVLNAKKKYYQKKDTIGYIASEYMDGTERKVKDLLKKLPQIEVDDKSGIVKYKGKEIETITLEGDDLFGKNYAIATKNINVDIVKAVEAIDNYEENDLVKGLTKGGKVALNLVLKENKTDLSGTIEGGLGTLDESEIARGLNSSLLVINKKHKSFLTASSNNVGVNNSPFNFESGIRTSEQNREKEYLSYSMIKTLNSNSNIGLDRGTINNQNFGNFNSLIPINKKLKIKLNGYYLKDKLTGQNFASQTLLTNEGSSEISIFDNTTFINKPEVYRADLDVKYRISKKSLLSIISKTQNIETNSVRNTASNIDNFNLNLNTNNKYFNNELEFTHKINDSTVFQSRLHYSFNTIPQQLDIKPASIQQENNNQISEFSKEYTSFSNILIGKIGRWKYGSQFDLYTNRVFYNSILSNDLNTYMNSSNDIERLNNSVFNQSYISLEYDKWRFTFKNKLQYLEQGLTGLSSVSDLIINPSLAITYTLGQNKTLLFAATYNKEPLELDNTFSNQILIDNRNFLSNSPSLELRKSYNLSINYLSNNLFKQLTTSSNLYYSENFGSYFQDITFDAVNIITRNFYLAERSKNISANFSVKKYISEISSNIGLNLSSNFYQYFNIINSSSLRENKLFSYRANFEFNTSFNSPFNLGNEISYDYTENRFNTGLNKFITLTNSSKIIFKSKNGIVSSLTSSFFNPNISNSNNSIHFLDYRLSYRPLNKNWSLNFTANNLLNNSFYQRIEVSDFSNSRFQNQLLGRLFMLSIEFSF